MTASDAAFSRGDVMRELQQLRDRVKRLETVRRLPTASIGSGGLRIQGGRLLAEDSTGARVFEVTTEPASIFMRQALIEDLSAQVFAARIHSADAPGQVNISHTSFAFDSATGGPTVADVSVTAAGRAIVFVSASIATDFANTGTEIRGDMGYEVSGATEVAPVGDSAVGFEFLNDTGQQNRSGLNATRMSLLTGLNQGLHSFEAKYRVSAFGASDEAIFFSRNLTVIAF